MLGFEPRRHATSTMARMLDPDTQSTLRKLSLPKQHWNKCGFGLNKTPIPLWSSSDPMLTQGYSVMANWVKLLLANCYSAPKYTRAICWDPLTHPLDFCRDNLHNPRRIVHAFTSDIAEKILSSQPDNATGGIPLGHAFNHRWLRFTHFCINGMFAAAWLLSTVMGTPALITSHP